MEEEFEHQKLIEKVSDYVNVRKELTLLKTVDKGSQIFANFLSDILVLVFAILAFLFGSFALSFYLSEILGNSYSGFLIVAGFYLLVAIILNSIKDKYLEKKIMNVIIAKFFRDRK
ncbi:phage holin family protein [Daejeonella sp.]|jgi:hypothetical protein|uniref:phage holin family protein n=1 Tax=Daejeonella sp. TaxID=2805397 RepID=UPI0037BE7E0C